MSQYVYFFSADKGEGNAGMRNLLGGKGANLAEMCNIGFPVPPGFTISTDVCGYVYENDFNYPEDLAAQVSAGIKKIEQITGKEFGSTENPLLLSVRSGSRMSMPGMMDTVLNLGLNDQTVAAMAAISGDDRFAFDSYRRFIQMYSDVVLGVDNSNFEEIIDDYKQIKGYDLDTDLSADDWSTLVDRFKAIVEDELTRPFPQDVNEQLWGAIRAVFDSWMSRRAISYRRLHAIPDHYGTAVNIQAMVFGNMGNDSATGVAFTRNPSTGVNEIFGEFMVNAQGEDVVAGIRTPLDITEKARIAAGSRDPSLEALMPEVFAELADVCYKLEQHYRDMQDIEFTIEKNKLWLLQTRTGKRATNAAIKIAVDLAKEGKISKSDAVLRIDPGSLDQLLHPTLDKSAVKQVITTGLPASPGAASGKVVFSADDAEEWGQKGVATILARNETSPEDIHGMHAASGIITVRGGMTSHAAVVARGMGRPCVTGAGNIRINFKDQVLTCGDIRLNKGDMVTVDGSSGEILLGEAAMVSPDLSTNFLELMSWADELRQIKVRTNAETANDVKTAIDFGAEGIGLCRTEHMFFNPERIMLIRKMILSPSDHQRQEIIDTLLLSQRSDFVELFEIMAGRPVTIRLIDPPLHEFLPRTDKEISEVADSLAIDVDSLTLRIAELRETNPMLGHRGCRLLVTNPEIAAMQVRAIFEAAIEADKEGEYKSKPEIMVPLVCSSEEFLLVRDIIKDVAVKTEKRYGAIPDYLVGTMIELPRAALKAGEIARHADFFSFGTNDLTQTTYGISRDDANSFFPLYLQKGLFAADPFATIDQDAVGELINIAIERGRQTNNDLKLGICGEHGGDPASIEFCYKAGLDYVSCSPFRVPVARIAAAQASIRNARIKHEQE